MNPLVREEWLPGLFAFPSFTPADHLSASRVPIPPRIVDRTPEAVPPGTGSESGAVCCSGLRAGADGGQGSAADPGSVH